MRGGGEWEIEGGGGEKECIKLDTRSVKVH